MVFRAIRARLQGKELSSPIVNVAWALVNLIVGWVLFRVGKVSSDNGALVAFFVGIIALSLWLSFLFTKRQASSATAKLTKS
jgi:hypothetical protein